MDIYYHEYGNILVAAKTMYSSGKTILGHKTNDFGHKNIFKK